MRNEDYKLLGRKVYRIIQDLSGATDEDAHLMVPLFSLTIIIILLLAISLLF